MAKKIQKKQIEDGVFVETKSTYSAPTQDNEFVQKKYVDDEVAKKANVTHTHNWDDILSKPTILKTGNTYIIPGIGGNIEIPASVQLPSWVTQIKPTYDWSEIQNKPSLDYLPLTGGTVTGDINFNGDFLLFKDKTKVHVRDNGNIAFGNKPFNDLVIGEFKGIQLWQQDNNKVVLAGGGVTNLSELKNNLIEKTIVNNEKVLESKDELPIKTRRNILTNNSGSRINLETLGNELTVTTHSGWARVQSNGYKIQGKDDNSVLTAGGNSKPLTQMFNDWYSTQGANIGTINTFKAYNNGTHKVDITGEGGILSVFKTNSSASSIELLVPGYGAHRLHFTHSIDNNRYAHPFKELAYFEDVYRPGIIRYDWDATKEHQNNTVFVNQSGYIELNQLENLSSMSFRKVFSNGSVEFRCSGKQIIYTGDNQFNGKDGSTAVVSIYENKCYIDIRNI